MQGLTPKRIQYVFDLSGVKYASQADIMARARAWDTFERVENHDDMVYQLLLQGRRDQLYYQFRDRAEANDYRIGMDLHTKRYPGVVNTKVFPNIGFSAVRLLPMPSVTFINNPPMESASPPSRGMNFSTPITALEYQMQQSDMAIYMHVSTYNSVHTYKYNFTSDEERLAYHRAEKRVRTTIN